MIKSLLNKKSKTVTAAAIILGAASLISRLLGLVRDRVLAGRFGAGYELDIYYAAFRVPDLVYSLLVLGAISAGFIPVFLGYLVEKERKKAWHLASSILNLLALLMVAVSLILIILAPRLVGLVAPGFSEEQLALAVKLTRVMFLSPILLGLSTVLGSILRSFQRFLIYSLSPILYNLAIIIGAVFLVDYFGLMGLAYGVVLGSLLHLLVQVPTVYLCGYRWRPVFDFRFEGAKRMFSLMPARVLGLSLSQINLWMMTILASLLTAGSITAYNLSENIWSFPLGIFGISFVLAAFPKLSEAAQKKDDKKFVKTLSLTARQIVFFTLPASVLFIVLSQEIVSIILGTGRFGAQDIEMTASTLAFLSPALFVEGLILLFLRAFFARENAWMPFWLGLVANASRLLAAWFLSREFGVAGLAMGFSLGSLVYLALLFAALKKKIGHLEEGVLAISFLKMLIASLLAGAGAFYLRDGFALLIEPNNFSRLFLQGLSSGLGGVLIYLASARLLGIRELKPFLSMLFIKRRKKNDSSEISN